jgi:cytochrome P450
MTNLKVKRREHMTRAEAATRLTEIADRLVNAVQDQGSMDLIGDFAFPLPITVICEMLGDKNLL